MAAPLKSCFCLSLRNKAIFRTEISFLKQCLTRAYASNITNKRDSKINPGDIFIQDDVQERLKRITRFDMDKIFKVRSTKHFDAPLYKLLTNEELEKVEEKSYEKAYRKLQMPPYLKQRKKMEKVVSDDPEIAGVETHPIAFTDISYGLPNVDRTIVVRETSGKLRMASHDERDRILQVYYPRNGKKLHVPEMFEENPLETLLLTGQYEYILDRACVQFEPNDPTYIRVSRRVYQYVYKQGEYDTLRSTRHFGPLCFYLAHYRKMEGLLQEMIQNDYIQDAADMVRIFHSIYPESKGKIIAEELTEPEHIIQVYLNHDSKHPEAVELALQTYKESLKQKKAVDNS